MKIIELPPPKNQGLMKFFGSNLLRKIAKSQYLGAWKFIFQRSWFHGCFSGVYLKENPFGQW